jgi:hypothetical protein
MRNSELGSQNHAMKAKNVLFRIVVGRTVTRFFHKIRNYTLTRKTYLPSFFPLS